MNKRVELYISAVVILAMGVSAWLYFALDYVDVGTVRAAACFAALATVAHVLRYDLARGASGSIAFIPYLALIVLAPSWVAVVSIASSVAVVEVLSQRQHIKTLFNVAQHALAVSVSVLAFEALGGRSMLSEPGFHLIPLLGLFAAFTITNTMLVSGAVALSANKSVWSVWKENTLRTVPYDFLSLPVVYAFAFVYVKSGALGVALLSVPLLGVRQLYITNWKLEKSNQDLLQLMVAAIEARDPYTSGHSRRVANYAKIIGRALALSGRQVDRIGVAALLHDVGKIHEVFAPILRKPARLSPEEIAVMQTHPIKSADLVQNVSQLKDVVLPIRHHHENWDGSGYPDGLAGDEIPLAARVIMFADTIDAMTSDRPYRNALSESEVRAEFVKLRGRQFDPQICDRLLASPLYGLLFKASEPTPASSPVLPFAARRQGRALRA